MELSQVRYFLKAAEILNFTRAAQQCGVTQPALTRAIRLLEAEFGAPLFHRERANTHLSELGRMVRPYLERLKHEADQAAGAARAYARLETLSLKLGVMCTIAPQCIVPLLGELAERHPGLNMEVLDGSGPDLERKLLAGELEAVIYANPKPDRDDRLHHVPLFDEAMLIVVAPQHPLATSERIGSDALRDHRYLARVHCEFGLSFDDVHPVADDAHRSDRDDWILSMAAAGLGYAFMPERCIPIGPHVARPLDPARSRRVNLTTVRGRPHSPAIGALVREAARHGARQAAVPI